MITKVANYSFSSKEELKALKHAFPTYIITSCFFLREEVRGIIFSNCEVFVRVKKYI